MDPGRDPTVGFFQGCMIVAGILLTSGAWHALSDPVVMDTVVQHWLSAIDGD